MPRFWLPLRCLIILTVSLLTVSAENETSVGKVLESFFSYKHINIFYGLDLEQEHGWHLYENLLLRILSQRHSDSAAGKNKNTHTFSLISVSAKSVAAASRAWSPLTEPPVYHQRNMAWGSLNLLLVDGANLLPLFEVLKELASDPMFLHSEDQTLIYQWHNYLPNLLYAPELKDFKYKAELFLTSSTPKFQSLCFYCNGGNPSVIDILHITKTDDIFPDSTKNLYGKVLKFSGSTQMSTMIDFRRTSNESLEYFGVFVTPSLNCLKEKMNFSISVHPTKLLGVRLPNGTYNGVLGEINNGNVDFGIQGQSVYGHMVAHYSHILVVGTVVFGTKWPAVTLKLHAIFRPFGLYAWCLLLGICFGVILPFFIFIHKASISIGNLKFKSDKSIFGNGLLFLFCPLLEQSLMKTHVSSQNSGRILLAFWLCTVLIITSVYKNKLRDLMIAGEPEDIPSTFQQLADFPQYELFTKSYGGALYIVFNSIKTPMYRSIAKRLQSLDSIVECLEHALRRPKAVCINYHAVIEREANLHFTDKMGRRMIRITSPSTGAFYVLSALASKKRAVFKEEMNSYMSRYYAMGLSDYGYLNDIRESLATGKAMAKSRNETAHDQYVSSDDDGPVQLKLKHFYLVFLMLILGLGVGCLAFLSERITYRREMQRRTAKAKI